MSKKMPAGYLSPKEKAVLPALQAESAANGHDFGVLEMVPWPDRSQLGGLVQSLMKKGVIVDIDRQQINWREKVTQYVLGVRYQR